MTLRRLSTALAVCPRKKNCFWAMLCLVLTMCIPSQELVGQTGYATVNGQVTDPQGRVVPGAEVQAVNIGTNAVYPAKTNNVGIYTIPGLPPGLYRVHVHRDGFKEVDLTDLTLHTQDTLEQNFQLEVGSTSESVTVDASTTNDSPAVSMTVTQAEVENIPLNGRSFQDLIALAPGTVSSAAGNGAYSIDGQRDDANNYTVDGVSANVGVNNASFLVNGVAPTQDASGSYPAQSALGTTQSLISIDAMQEFKIETSGYSAEYGRQPGGQIAITSRSGSNDIHGTAFDYLRNTVFDANNWFTEEIGQPRTPEHQNDFGGTIGAPLSVPKLYDGKDRTFLFLSYEGLRLLQPQLLNEQVSTASLRQSVAPGVLPYLNVQPLPNGTINPGGLNGQFIQGYDTINNLDSWSARFDEVVSRKIRLFARVADTNSYTEAPSGMSTLSEFPDRTFSGTLGATLLLGPSLVDELRFNYSKASGEDLSLPHAEFGGIPLPYDDLGIPGYENLPGGFFSEFALGTGDINSAMILNRLPLLQSQDNLTDSISWVHRTHALKFGVDYRHLMPVFSQGQYLSYFGAFSPQDLFTGDLNSSNGDFYESGTHIVAKPIYDNLSLFAQDHWKMARNLTFDFGLRWEFNPHPGASNGLYPLALTSSDLATAALAPSGTPVYQNTYTNFAPRAGFAWRTPLSKNHPIVLRGGTGVFYDTGQQLAASAYGAAPPFSAFNYPLTSFVVPLPLGPSLLAPPQITTALTAPYNNLSLSLPDLKLPYTVQYNLSADYGVTERDTLTVSYVGNLGERLLWDEYGLSGNALFGGYYNSVATNESVSHYNALQVRDQGFVAPGLQLIASYTWAHATDNASTEVLNPSGNVSSTPTWGNSDNDIRQAFNAALNYDVPAAKENAILKTLSSGWLLSSRFTAETGYPFNIEEQIYFTSTGDGSLIYYPDLVTAVPIYLHNAPNVPGNWELNSAAFAEVPLNSDGYPIRQGTLGRNFVHGPNFWNLNTAVQRAFPITERFRFLLRADAFNVFNHPNFADPDPNISDSTFGQLGGLQTIGVPNALYASGAPRSLQFSLKLQF